EGLTKHFRSREGLLEKATVHAVDDVSFSIEEGETFGLVGESGSGKSTLGRCILRIIEPTAGRVWFGDQELTALRGEALRKVRLRLQAVFQNPVGSLNPRMRAGTAIAEPLRVHQGMTREEADARVKELLGRVGLRPEVTRNYPHELSGGQCQRIAIARALAVEPRFLVLDEPTSSLDVSVQAQIVNLLKDLQRDLGLTYLFITHDLSLVSYLADHVAVMYLGKLMEIGDALEVLERGSHPYTRALLSAVPVPDPSRKRGRIVLPGEIPSALDPPSGCRFRTRCPWAQERCAIEEPFLRDVRTTRAACHFAESIVQEVSA
ncbi:MAG TPA: ABC transporter ATP-binding protein, partial [Thermoplasmata archaeon]|nr:ABC transporter ATP-binding protein [Thermoplasmata archaeon]